MVRGTLVKLRANGFDEDEIARELPLVPDREITQLNVVIDRVGESL